MQFFYEIQSPIFREFIFPNIAIGAVYGIVAGTDVPVIALGNVIPLFDCSGVIYICESGAVGECSHTIESCKPQNYNSYFFVSFTFSKLYLSIQILYNQCDRRKMKLQRIYMLLCLPPEV